MVWKQHSRNKFDLPDKENWQRKTFQKIKDSLISVRENRFVEYSDVKEEHLVMVYGKSQVGKTILILNMIGLKEEYLKEVYETLRAEMPRGNSSTSTAIIYTKSRNSKYGCWLSGINAPEPDEVSDYDGKGLIGRLKEIREDVENGRADENQVLHIAIPENYFKEDSVERISIMDMPGVESCNHKEDEHVRNLMVRYLAIASVCVIVCRGNDIVSLGSLELPGLENWKGMEQRFILVLTYAYNAANIRDYFRKERDARDKAFYDYVKEEYGSALRGVLGEENKTEIYSVELGDALKKLCTEEVQDEEDRKEILSTKDRVLEELRESIVSRKGTRLKVAIEGLRQLVDCSSKSEIEELEKLMEDRKAEISEKEELISKSKKQADEFFPMYKKEEEAEKEELENLRQKMNECRNACICGLASYGLEYADQEKLWKSNRAGNYLRDKKGALFAELRRFVNEGEEGCFHKWWQKWTEITERADSDIRGQAGEKSFLQFEIENIIERYRHLLYPRQGLLVKKERIWREGENISVSEICAEIENYVNELCNKQVDQCVEKIDEKITERGIAIGKFEGLISYERNRIDQAESDIIEIKKNIEEIEAEINAIKERQEHDRETLKVYLKYAREAFEEQRNQIVKQLNCSKPDIKLYLFLELGLLEDDYRKVIGEE